VVGPPNFASVGGPHVHVHIGKSCPDKPINPDSTSSIGMLPPNTHRTDSGTSMLIPLPEKCIWLRYDLER